MEGLTYTGGGGTIIGQDGQEWAYPPAPGDAYTLERENVGGMTFLRLRFAPPGGRAWVYRGEFLPRRAAQWTEEVAG